MPVVVLVVLALIWGLILVPPVVRARRKSEQAVVPMDVAVVIERKQTWWLAPLLFLAALPLGVDAIAHGDVGGGLASTGLFGVGAFLLRHRQDGPLAIADTSGLELPGRGRLAWAEIDFLVPFASALDIVATPGAPPARIGRTQRLLLRIDRAATGYDVWGALPSAGAQPGDGERLLTFVRSQGIEILEAKPGAGRRMVRLVAWFLSP